jgi:hypothetical protein
MTELKDVDSLLRDSFARIAEPGDPAGVVDSIRARMDAGDTGTPADSSGFGSGSGLGSWLPWGAMVVVAGLVGTGLGLSGLVGSPAAGVVPLTVLAVDATTDAYDCPSGAAVSTFSANERALVVARTEDSEWLAVRDSYDYSHTVWLPASVVSVDAGQGDVDAVPVQDCVVPEVVVNTPAPVPVETAGPKTPDKPTPGESVAPTIQKISAVPTVIVNDQQTVVEVQASDNVGVTGVNIVISGAYTGSGTMTKVGNVWQFSFSIADDNYYGNITFTARAVDAAGNQSAPSAVVVDHQYFG